MAKQTAAQMLGLVSRRFNGRIYPTPEQEADLLEHATAVRQVQNAIIWRIRNIHEHKYGPFVPNEERKFICQCPGTVIRDRETHQCDGTEKCCVLGKFPSEKEVSHWATELIAYDARLGVMSTWTTRRAAAAIYDAYQHAFRRLRNGEDPGFPEPRKPQGRVWIPYIHIKRKGDIGSAGSGCELKHTETNGETVGHLRTERSRRRAARHWHLNLQGIKEPIYTRLALPIERGGTCDEYFTEFALGRFLDVDIELRGGKWHISVCVHEHTKRRSGNMRYDIKFDLMDGFAWVNGVLETPDELYRAIELKDEADRMQSVHDLRFPHGKVVRGDELEEKIESKQKIRALKIKIAAIIRNSHHIWTTRIIARSNEINVEMPRIKEFTKSPRGDTKQWGAATEIVSNINRHVLSYAAHSAVMMLQYKAQEAGVRYTVVADASPKVAVGGDLKSAGIDERRARRKLKDVENELRD